jgi:hypothetical protein
MKSKNWVDANEGKMDGNSYFNELTKEFSAISNQIKEEGSEMIHMKMETFARYTIEQIKQNNYFELKRCLDFQESKIDLLHSDLVNALNVSYCESLLLGECAQEMAQVLKLMGPKLKAHYLAYERYYSDLVKRSNEK